MNGLSRKLHELKDNVLEFPPHDDDIPLHIGNRDEQLLHDRANRIRESLKTEAQAIIDGGASVDKQNEAAKQLLRLGVDLSNPDTVETMLATEKFTVAKKYRLVAAYRSYCRVSHIQCDPIKTHYASKQPFVPLESELDALISAAGKTTATFLQVAKDTGVRSGK